MSSPAETDPKKIAERLEQTRQARQQCKPKSGEEASCQLREHARQARQAQGNGPQMAAALERIAQSGTLAGVDAEAWQREVRTDKPLAGRDE